MALWTVRFLNGRIPLPPEAAVAYSITPSFKGMKFAKCWSISVAYWHAWNREIGYVFPRISSEYRQIFRIPPLGSAAIFVLSIGTTGLSNISHPTLVRLTTLNFFESFNKLSVVL